ncbi:MAG: adenylate/guanylate cyclase domain-containing protein [Rhodocyclaceae bacterium]|jgi:class 3 adenylate cyclase|nr:adenylate/guanylate cyclase domain-containing protein [Rhodocyclaceae bacterium]
MPQAPQHRPAFLARLRAAGVSPQDPDDVRLSKTLMVFATGLMCLVSGLWLLLYWLMGPRLPSTLSFFYQLLLATNLAFFILTDRFDWFRISQLALFLFFPFVAQWSLGNFITASGLILWGLLAPIGALLCLGTREAVPWFLAYLFLTALTGFFDFYLADFTPQAASPVSIRTSVVFFAINFAAISGIVFALLHFAIREKRHAQQRLEEAHHLLQQEQDRSERLLLNILPAPVAKRLKDSNQTIADGFAEVTVMFADIVNFTHLASGMSAQQVFAMLNEVFSRFDELAEKFGLEKIKTIGDAYMVAGGLNAGNPAPAAAIADLALAMGEAARAVPVAGQALELRIGIGTGPVVAGVVGKKKFIYDLWGDTVNLASRLTSDGQPGAIQCDARSFELLADSHLFAPPLESPIKGKGAVTIHRLLARRNPELQESARRASAAA